MGLVRHGARKLVQFSGILALECLSPWDAHPDIVMCYAGRKAQKSGGQVMHSLSVAVVAKNESENLARTLASVTWADEIVLIDSGSTDNTVEIAKSYGATVYHENWKGYGAQVNSALDKCTSEWILNLDADEELTPELAEEIQTILAGGGTKRIHGSEAQPDFRQMDASRWPLPRLQTTAIPQGHSEAARRHRTARHPSDLREDWDAEGKHAPLSVSNFGYLH